jgi:AcrR family transcriptional regulator
MSALEHLQRDVENAIAGHSDPLDRIGVFIHAHLATLLKDQIRHVTVLTGLHGLTDKHRADVLARRKQYAALVRSLIEAGQDAGVLRTDIPAHYLYLALLNMLNWAVFWFRQNQESPADEVARYFRILFLEGAQISFQPGGMKLDLASGGAHAKTRAKPAKKSTPEKMLDRAAALFSSKGYTATSTREIAAGLGMRKASLYYHIATKEDLLYTIARTSLEQIRADVESALASEPDPQARMRVLIRAHIESLLRDQNRHEAALAEMHLLSAEPQAQVIALRDGYEEMVRRVLQESQDRGMIRRDIPLKHLSLGLLGLMNRVVVWYRPGGALSSTQLGDLLAEVYLGGSLSSNDRQVKKTPNNVY